MTLTWNDSVNKNAGVVNFGLIPGPLNSVMELFTSYVQADSPTKTSTVQAYSDPSLSGLNDTVGTTAGTARRILALLVRC